MTTQAKDRIPDPTAVRRLPPPGLVALKNGRLELADVSWRPICVDIEYALCTCKSLRRLPRKPHIPRRGMDPVGLLPPVETGCVRRFLLPPAILRAAGLSRTTVYRVVAERTFPARARLGEQAVVWRRDYVEQGTCGRPGASR